LNKGLAFIRQYQVSYKGILSDGREMEEEEGVVDGSDSQYGRLFGENL
jgi:hypothetical protein